jgi:hypothetical protein
MNIKFIAEVLWFSTLLKNMNQNNSIIPCFVEKNPKQYLKFVVSKQNLWFFTTNTYSSYSSPKFYVLKSLSLFKNLSLWVVPCLHHDSKPTRIQNLN